MTSRDVYNRIRWDPRIEASRVTVGFEDRFRGVVDLPFGDAKLGRDVPWHRVQHFRYEGRLVWDRDGLDLLDSLAGDEAPSGPDGCWRWDGPGAKRWVAVASPPVIPWDGRLRLLSLNVLFDLYDRSVPSTESRFPTLLQLLKDSEADLIALQEVTPKLLALLEGEVWIRDRYCLSHSSEQCGDLQPYGQVLLCRFPFSGESRPLAAGKTVYHARLPLASGSVDVVVLHLASDRSPEAATLRGRQLEEALAYLDADSSGWLVGDFNERGPLELPGFRDAWLSIHPGQEGLTFSPYENALAGHTSVRRAEARFDRLLTRGSWTPSSTWLPRPSASLSDHEPLCCDLLPPLFGQPVHRSALVLMPPENEWEPLQALRREHDKSYRRWMPHINLLYGFLPEERFADAVERLAPFLASYPGFTIRLREFHRFEHRGSTTIWLRPESEPAGRLEALQAELQRLFPHCTEQGRHSPAGFTPHLTVASLRPDQREPEWPEIDLTFRVSELCLISRREDEPFEVRHRLRLSGEAPEAHLPESVERDAVALELGQRAGRPLYPVGSLALGLALPWSDVDLLGLGQEAPEEFFSRLGPGRLVPGRVPLWRGQVEGVKVDLQYARLPEGCSLEDPALWSEAFLARLSEEARRAVQSRREVAALGALVALPRLRPLLRAVRAWTHARHLETPGLGFPGGAAWAQLAAGVLRSSSAEASLTQQMARFFACLEDWPWPRPWRADGKVEGELTGRKGNERFPVSSLTSPRVNLAPGVTDGTRQILLNEFRRGRALMALERWQELLDSPSRGRGFCLRLRGTGLELEQAHGWLESRFLTLLLDLEREGCLVRPHAVSSLESRLELWCEVKGEPSGGSLARFAKAFSQQPFADQVRFEVDQTW